MLTISRNALALSARSTRVLTAAALLAFPSAAMAQPDENPFHAGPMIKDYGPIADVAGRKAIPDGATFKVSFDVSAAADAGALNRALVSGARFLNMHAEAGVPADNMSLAFVIHGKAVTDVTHNAFYTDKTGAANANAGLIAALIDAGVRIEVCGQSAAFYGVSADDLAPGVEMVLSAMTAHAMLQQEGYSLNPF